MIYLDTSGAMKLVRRERHSGDLSRWLEERRGAPVLSSAVIGVELMRATRQSAPESVGRAVAVLGGIGVVALSPAVIDRAAAYGDPELRSLDAIHLASAEHAVALAPGALEAFVAHDERLLAAARRARLPVAAPGIS